MLEQLQKLFVGKRVGVKQLTNPRVPNREGVCVELYLAEPGLYQMKLEDGTICGFRKPEIKADLVECQGAKGHLMTISVIN